MDQQTIRNKEQKQAERLYFEGEELFKQGEDYHKEALIKYLKPALQELSGFVDAAELLKLMHPYWGAFRNMKKIEEPQLKPNLKYIVADLKNSNIENLEYNLLFKANWPNLKYLHLTDNKIGKTGCQLIAKSNWSNLVFLSLQNCSIENEGCRFIMMSKWPDLQTIYLNYNYVGNQGCMLLSQANWPNLKCLYVTNIGISNRGCLSLMKSCWSGLKIVYFNGNKILNKNDVKHMFEKRFALIQYCSL